MTKFEKNKNFFEKLKLFCKKRVYIYRGIKNKIFLLVWKGGIIGIIPLKENHYYEGELKMKKTITLILTTLILFTLVIVPISAANYDDQVAPCYNNTMKASAAFQIADNGLATITLNYLGHPSYVTGATITSYVQKSTSGGWVDVSGASWLDEVTGVTNTIVHSVQLTSRGTYRLVFEFEIRGTGGAADIISDNIEDTY